MVYINHFSRIAVAVAGSIILLLTLVPSISTESETHIKAIKNCFPINAGKASVGISKVFQNQYPVPNIQEDEFARFIHPNENSGPQIFYCEADLDDYFLDKIKIVTDWAANTAILNAEKTPEILLSLRYTSTEMEHVTEIGVSYSLPKLFLKYMEQFGSHLTNKVSFEYTGATDPCPNDNNRNLSDVVENIKRALKECANCNHNLSIGYTVKQETIECQSLFRNVQEADFIVIKLDFEANRNFDESYSVFKRYLDFVYQESMIVLSKIRSEEVLTLFNLQYVANRDEVNPILHDRSDHKMYKVSRAYMDSKRHAIDRGKALNVHKKYECLFKMFVREWTASRNSIFILSHSETYEDFQCERNVNSTSLLIPHIGSLWYEKWKSFGSHEKCSFIRSIQVSIDGLRKQGFQSVMMDEAEWDDLQNVMSSFSSACKHNSETNPETSDGNTNMLNATIIGNPMYSRLLSGKITASHEPNFGIRIQKPSCLISLEDMTTPVPQMSQLEIVNFHGAPRYSQNASEILDVCDNIILYTDLRFKLPHYTKFQHSWITDLKESVFLAESMIQRRWANKTITLLLSDIVSELDDNTESETMYCNQNRAILSDYFEAIFNWADIFEIPVILPSFPSYSYRHSNSPVFWYKLIPERDISFWLQETFPLYLRRSYNKSKVFGKWTNGMYPCLDWIHDVPPNGVGFESSRNVGTYVHFHLHDGNETAVTKPEMLVMMMYVLSTFSFTEVYLSNLYDVDNFFDILISLDFEQSLIGNSIGKVELFLNVPLNMFQPQNYTLQLLYNKFKNFSMHPDNAVSIHIHFSDTSDDYAMPALNEMYEIVKTSNVQNHARVGMELNDCFTIIDALGKSDVGYSGNETFSENVTIYYKVLSKLSYVVCPLPTKHFISRSKLKMEQFLETHIYVKRILQIFFPNLREVYFKMLPSTLTPSTDVQEFMILLSHMTQFANAYNISYFLLPAFASQNSEELSWWEISDYSGLSDVQTYTGIQSKYQARTPRRPIVILGEMKDAMDILLDKNGKRNETPYHYVVEIFGVLSIVFFAVLLLSKRKVTVLSDQEVEEFLNGCPNEMEFMGFSSECNAELLNNEYNSEYEIHKCDITIEFNNILGMGNFGVVYKGTINDDTYVDKSAAVKIPKDGCDKQAFIGMLHEVKLLTHLGSHQNIVGFIGCYTKEIQKGTLYVVLELCTGGSLLSHLRGIKSKMSTLEPEEIFVDLIRFCRDITNGMRYISSRKVIHGDISARNVLLDAFQVCKISDFGLSRKLYHYRTYSAKKTEGPLPWRWLAYESLTKLNFSTMSDVWSFGVTAWEIFSLGDVPYPGLGWSCDFIKELEKGVRLTTPSYGTSEIYNTIASCWNIEPDERPDFTTLFNFFVGLLPYIKLE